MRLGYNTNGLTGHDLESAIHLLANIGYQSVAITLDHHCLNPFRDDLPARLAEIKNLLVERQLASVIETGARYLLDPRIKHSPTLLSKSAGASQRRREFLCRAIDIAAFLGSECVSLWSGVPEERADVESCWVRLVQQLQFLLDYAQQKGVVLGFEPEPGMLVATMDDYQRLLDLVGREDLMLTLDVGHLHCLGEVPIADRISHWKDRIVNVHIEDMLAGVHEHLMFGEGEMEFAPILASLSQVGYEGGVYVELSRHSHAGPSVAAESFQFLSSFL